MCKQFNESLVVDQAEDCAFDDQIDRTDLIEGPKAIESAGRNLMRRAIAQETRAVDPLVEFGRRMRKRRIDPVTAGDMKEGTLPSTEISAAPKRRIRNRTSLSASGRSPV
jgi:hypothetical protein